MYYIVVPVVVVLWIALLALGFAGGRRYWALYLLSSTWLCGLLLAAYAMLEVWRGRAYSENWAMIGVIFFVWPYTLAVTLFGTLELVLLRADMSIQARRCKLLSGGCIALLWLFSLSALVL